MPPDLPSSTTRAKYLDALSLTCACLPLIAIAIDVWGVVYYRQGLRNDAMSFANSAVGIAIVLSLAIAGLLLRAYALTKDADPRAMFTWLLLPLILMAWPAMCLMRPMPLDIYKRGLADWAREKVNADAIRACHATLTPVTSPTTLPPTLAPAIVDLSPDRVEQHPGGILLQWGQVGRLPGRQRKLFVAIDESAQPPDEGRRFWNEVSPGLFIGTHNAP